MAQRLLKHWQVACSYVLELIDQKQVSANTSSCVGRVKRRANKELRIIDKMQMLNRRTLLAFSEQRSTDQGTLLKARDESRPTENTRLVHSRRYKQYADPGTAAGFIKDRVDEERTFLGLPRTSEDEISRLRRIDLRKIRPPLETDPSPIQVDEVLTEREFIVGHDLTHVPANPGPAGP